jgi:hypothetical protein
MNGSTPEKATLTNLTASPAVTITCQFNPTELTFTKTNTWDNRPAQGQNAGISSFGGGKPSSFSLDLLFDTTDTGADVRTQYTDKLLAMMAVPTAPNNPNQTLSEPPRIRFQWGVIRAYDTIITSITLNFTYFKPDGTPVRAKAKVDLQEIVDEKVFSPQNPTSMSKPRRVWVVTEGETLDWIAYQEYGSAAHWRHIAETNNIDNPLDISAGQTLVLFPLP